MAQKSKKVRRGRDFAIKKIGIEGIQIRDWYHSLLGRGASTFVALLAIAFLGVNAIFATLYYAAGPDALEGLSGNYSRWLECYFFSIQTFATIGYGKIGPATLVAHAIVTLEAMTQVMLLALATGLFFARFSRPKARLVYSKQAIIGQLDGDPCLYFRVANERFNQIVGAKITLVLFKKTITKEGKEFRTIEELALEHAHVPFFALSWTVCHIIDKKSPLYEKTRADIEAMDPMFLVSIQGLDDVLNQEIYSRYSYPADALEFDTHFVDMMKTHKDGIVEVNIANISKTHT